MKNARTAYVEIGAYEARTRLHELLREVRAGRRFTITNRGKAIAELVPSETSPPTDPAAAIDKFRAFMRENPLKACCRVDIDALIDEGRE